MSNNSQFEDMQAELRSLRGLIYEVDTTTFGKLDHLFDRMAKVVDRAIDLADVLEVNIDWENA
jgi:hypothetical protein